MFKPTAFFIITPFSLLYMKIDIFLTCGKNLHDRIILLRVKIWAHKTSVFPELFIGVYQLRNVTVMSLYLRGIDFASFYHFYI